MDIMENLTRLITFLSVPAPHWYTLYYLQLFSFTLVFSTFLLLVCKKCVMFALPPPRASPPLKKIALTFAGMLQDLFFFFQKCHREHSILSY